MKIHIGKYTIFIVFLIILSTSSQVSSESWPMFFSDPQHSGNSITIAPNTSATLWSVPSIGGNGYSSPVVANGKMFVNKGGGGILYCLYELNGTEIWNVSIGFAGESCSTPAYADGLVYIIGDKLYCFYENNGTELWSNSLSGGGIGTSSPTVSDGRVLVNTQILYCFYASNGTEIWNNFVGGDWEPSTPAVANDKVFVNGDQLYCFYAENGTEIWNTTGDESTSPVIANGRVFLHPYQIYCLYENNGTEIWSKPIGSDSYSTPAVFQGNIFLNNNGDIYCLYQNNGTQIWQATIEGAGCSTPAVDAQGKIYLTGGSYTYCLNGTNGEEIWKKSTGGEGYSSPAISNERVFVNQGTVYCLGGPPPTIDYIGLLDDNDNILTSITLDIGEWILCYAVAYNKTEGLLYDVDVSWSLDDDIATANPAQGNFTNITAVINGTCNLFMIYNISISNSTPVTVRPPMSTPKGLVVTALPSGNALNITWSANPEEYLAGYDIYRSQTLDGVYSKINTELILTEYYVDDSLTTGVRYYYCVIAVNDHQKESRSSDKVSGIPDFDSDSDGLLNYEDDDDDNDNYPDTEDAFPLNPLEWLDTDSDTIGNNADDDDDGDGLLDTEEDKNGNGVVDPGETDPLDADSDDDGHDDSEDYYPLDKSKWKKQEEEEFPMFLLLIVIVIIILLVILMAFLKKRKSPKAPFEQKGEEDLIQSDLDKEQPSSHEEDLQPPKDEEDHPHFEGEEKPESSK
ncbi:MAG: PQQ-binding-like beta-propeller repeat protein [Thermoplasmata archaeon]|nr:MAG: PQQ-binding-like beta-propeller repeat protein [Thermoplasmata archaeon]